MLPALPSKTSHIAGCPELEVGRVCRPVSVFPSPFPFLSWDIGSLPLCPSARAFLSFPFRLKLSVGRTILFHLLEIEGLFTQGWRPGRTVGASVGGISEIDSADWSNVIRHHTLDTRSDTDFNGHPLQGYLPVVSWAQ